MIWLLKAIVILLILATFAIVVARMVFTIPVVEDRVDDVALAPPEHGPLASRAARNRPGLTGVAPLGSGTDAFAARILLANAAVSSIDAQYYIWHSDLTGSLLLEALRRAADRGVRVRLLLDDNGTNGLDAEIAQLDAHENAEVRLYNPFNLRRFKRLSFGFDFFRLNRRMHNKSFIVDGLATIVGGRNIGDEYFGTGRMPLFVDLDIMAVGKIVPEVAADFDRYWASPSVHLASTIVRAKGGDPISERLSRWHGSPKFDQYRVMVEDSEFMVSLSKGTLDLEWTDAVLVSDDPVKGQGAVPREDLLTGQLTRAVGSIERRIDGVTPYFVPGAAGVKTFAVDGKRIFIGSFNFDPRSVQLNTEMGLLIDSEVLANRLHVAFDDGFGGLAWRVEAQKGKLAWVDPVAGTVTTEEPGSSTFRNLALKVIGWLPVEWLF